MKTFFTSDLHLQSSEAPGIIEWAHRPFKSVAKHDAALIRGINERCKPDDLLIHVGDLMNYGKNRGAEAGRNKPDFYLSQIKCQVVCLEGNHDPNNHVRTIGRTLTTKVGRYVVSVGHYPSWDDRAEVVYTPEYICNTSLGDSRVRIHLCGHVHDAWRYKVRDWVLNINIGTDAWKYRPVSESELDAYIGKILVGKA
jgi:calcineurin-like phosphoesterase family protein